MVSIAFRVSDAEAKQIRDAALNEGSTVSQYVRKKVFSDSNSSLITVQKEQKADLLKLLESTGNLEINQKFSNELLQIILRHLIPENYASLVADAILKAEEGN
ncbi:MAG: hypothetical protein E7198_10795 [Schwartzia succinivorans]|uniref:plasmid mobilization protein n=1 Tax=Schwartzia succinivorans TaxID=55507 RepID=UPI00235592E4|nr:hypothetical protein [Schwartzia succinivorans]MBE6098254.1 hypothetical protein [Schwartzia succinivorans]